VLRALFRATFVLIRFEPSFHLHHHAATENRLFLFSSTAPPAKLLCHCAIHRDNQTKTKKKRSRAPGIKTKKKVATSANFLLPLYRDIAD
jgi:hypothetical protein